MFKDRKDAGKQLASALERYKDQDVIVLAIPRGGVEVGYQVAMGLNAEFSLIVTRKLPMPDNPESGFGAIAEDGSLYLIEDSRRWVHESVIEETVEEQKKVVQDRIRSLRNGKPLPDIRGRTVILVDDGIAMGSTMRASVELCRNKQAERVVVAAPVSGKHTKDEFEQYVDDVIVLETPPGFRAVAQVYENWHDVSDREVIEIMKENSKL